MVPDDAFTCFRRHGQTSVLFLSVTHCETVFSEGSFKSWLPSISPTFPLGFLRNSDRFHLIGYSARASLLTEQYLWKARSNHAQLLGIRFRQGSNAASLCALLNILRYIKQHNFARSCLPKEIDSEITIWLGYYTCNLPFNLKGPVQRIEVCYIFCFNIFEMYIVYELFIC